MDDKLNKVREALGLVIRTGSNLHAEGGISGWDAFEAACEKADKLFSTIDAEPVERVTPSMRDILHDMRNIAEESGKRLDEVRKKYGLDAEPVASSAQPAQAQVVPEEALNKIIDLACEAKAGWLKSQSDDGAEGTKGSEIYHARKSDIRAMLSASPALPQQGEKDEEFLRAILQIVYDDNLERGDRLQRIASKVHMEKGVKL